MCAEKLTNGQLSLPQRIKKQKRVMKKTKKMKTRCSEETAVSGFMSSVCCF